MLANIVDIDVVRRDTYARRVAKKKTSRKSLRGKLPDQIADAIKAEAEAQELNPYKLAMLVKDYVAPTTIYQFSREGRGLRTEIASVLLEALGLEIKKKKE